jgi:hypothetical protein
MNILIYIIQEKALTFCNVEEVKIIEESVQTSDSDVEELEEDED